MKLSILAIACLSMAANVGAAPILEDTFTRTIPLDANATISVRNASGTVWIYGADVREVKMQAIKKAYSQERLDAIQIDVSATAQSLSIETRYPPSARWSLRDRSGTVDYVLVVPWTCKIEQVELANGEVLIDGMRGAVARGRLENGRMFVHNCFGNTEVEVVNGGLDVGYDWWEERKFSVTTKAVNGNTHAFLPGDAAFHLLASSVNGHVVSDFSAGQDRQRSGARKIDIVVPGDPRAELNLQSVNGSIQVAEIKF